METIDSFQHATLGAINTISQWLRDGGQAVSRYRLPFVDDDGIEHSFYEVYGPNKRPRIGTIEMDLGDRRLFVSMYPSGYVDYPVATLEANLPANSFAHLGKSSSGEFTVVRHSGSFLREDDAHPVRRVTITEKVHDGSRKEGRAEIEVPILGDREIWSGTY
ncbi:MAG TPA: hypothetical protein VEY30_02910 [Myxococcaceae bacterium]|nr:hypothetical protein [Myxococcaceae bacterium]